VDYADYYQFRAEQAAKTYREHSQQRQEYAKNHNQTGFALRTDQRGESRKAEKKRQRSLDSDKVSNISKRSRSRSVNSSRV
jgi:hypothetical protein